jgi:PhoPQ-activated pathogenicity-related protein
MLILFFISLALLLISVRIDGTALDDYVWKNDNHYSWTRMTQPEKTFSGEIRGKKWTGYTLNFTSQQWLTDDVFSPNSDTKSVWWHYLVVIVPENVAWKRNATLYITGGWNTGTPPSAEDEDVLLAATLSIGTNMITGTLFNVPNEHAIFKDDPIQKDRSEDSMIAYTWDHFLKDPSQPEWLLYFPMVKAAVRAMDAVKEFTQQTFPELETSLDYYCVAGASKRGWTTWLTAAIDSNRVKGAIPIVLDLINFVEFAHHQYRSYSGWTWALQDYIDMNIMTRLEDPNMILLQQLIDPYFYRDRLTVPKLVVNAVLDEFQEPGTSPLLPI